MALNPHIDHQDKFVPLVNRIRGMMWAGLTDAQIGHQLVGEGQSPADVWLCIMAARILDA